MDTVTLQIRQMSCQHCVRAVEQALRKVAGVTETKVSVGEAIVTTEGPADLAALRAAIQDAGYELA